MTGMRWARLQEDLDCKLRRGAWYRVSHVAGLEAIVDVNRRALAVPSFALEIVSTPPHSWTVVPLRGRGARLAAELAPRYGVCPSCRHRSRLEEQGRSMTCGRCKGRFDIAWDEGYLDGK
jgi:Zn finger protein HypA/HybF involved in hydrogenase expression